MTITVRDYLLNGLPTILMLMNLLNYFFISPFSPSATMIYSIDSPVVPQQPFSNQKTSSTTTRRRVYHNATHWIGKLWIPPKHDDSLYRYYSPQEMRNYFENFHILFVGDSIARRNYITLYHILTHANNNMNTSIQLAQSNLGNTSMININKKIVSETCRGGSKYLNLCRTLDDSSGMVKKADLLSQRRGLPFNGGCANELQNAMFEHDIDIASTYNLVVVMMGGWHQYSQCKNSTHTDLEAWDTIPKFITKLSEIPPQDNLTIVWSTMGTIDTRKKKKIQTTKQQNQKHVDLILEHENDIWQHQNQLSTLTVLDWATIMYPRSNPHKDRIRGDMEAHFGLEARIVFLQMLMNHLVERDRISKNTNQLD